MINQPCSKPTLFSSPPKDGQGAFTARVARLQARLAEAMLQKQETWRPESLVDDPRAAQRPLLIRRATATARVLQEMPIEIAEDELLVGKTARNGIIVRTTLPEFATAAEKENARQEGFAIAGGLSH